MTLSSESQETLDTESLFGQAGKLTSLPGFQYREAQESFALAIDQSLKQDIKVTLAEAGTGVGKTLGYLIPALLEAERRSCPVILSTFTHALQHQVMNAEVKIIEQLLPFPIFALEVRGRRNYLGRRRLLQAFDDHPLHPGLKQAVDQLDDNRSGLIDHLKTPLDSNIREEVWSDPDDCLGRKCPHYGPCYVQSLRRQIPSASLLVVNHALFLSDRFLAEDPLLPKDAIVIIDEAHHFSEVALQVIGGRFHPAKGIRMLSSFLGSGSLFYEAQSQQGLAKAQALMIALEGFKQQFGETVADQQEVVWSSCDDQGLRAISLDFLTEAWRSLEELDDEALNLFWEGRLKPLERFLTEAQSLIASSREQYVVWVQRERGEVMMTGAPIAGARDTGERLLASGGQFVFTSATLGAKQPFTEFSQELGLDVGRAVQFDSPFDWAQQMTLHMDATLPDPRHHAYTEHLADSIEHHLKLSDGRAFVLFTSRRMLNQVSELMTDFMHRQPWDWLVQNRDGSRGQLLQKFKQSKNAVLFGLSSFWTGVDVPGESLSNVIITRLPFEVPDTPWLNAHQDWLKQRGGQPFWERSLPKAITRLRQGVGRLIRHEDDKGLICILDPRIMTSSYGKRILAALPPSPAQIRQNNDDFTSVTREL